MRAYSRFFEQVPLSGCPSSKLMCVCNKRRQMPSCAGKPATHFRQSTKHLWSHNSEPWRTARESNTWPFWAGFVVVSFHLPRQSTRLRPACAGRLSAGSASSGGSAFSSAPRQTRWARPSRSRCCAAGRCPSVFFSFLRVCVFWVDT